MQSDSRVPVHVAFDVGQGEGTVHLPYELAFRGLQGYWDGRLLLLCSFCEALLSVPHNERDKQPFSLRYTPEGEHVECQACRASRGVGPLATEVN